eukprot:TRINITY_DN32926_c0_g3_i2.p1 TRINITY_DN32926_c0_g3~~TRINITY_DN32926_c0_g3_i2.p1  ORF type:complete len:400 (-),score=42.37 TRINITY_DN32926_c0_g3_i2:368-1510(-)
MCYRGFSFKKGFIYDCKPLAFYTRRTNFNPNDLMQIGTRRRSGYSDSGGGLSIPAVLLILIVVPQLSYLWLHRSLVRAVSDLQDRVDEQGKRLYDLYAKVQEFEQIKTTLEETQLSLTQAVEGFKQQGQGGNNYLQQQQQIAQALGDGVTNQGQKKLLDVAAQRDDCQHESVDLVPPIVAAYFSKDTEGVYVDVGAGDGIFNSMTLYFDKVLCWKGVALEPAQVEFPKLKANRPRALTLNAALCEESGQKIFSDITSDWKWTGWSGFQDTFSEKKRHEVEKVLNGNDGWLVSEYNVECVNGKELFQELGTKHIDLMVLQVEGHEIEALKGIPDDVLIDVLVVDLHHRPQQLIELLQGRGYRLHKKMNKSWIFLRQGFTID